MLFLVANSYNKLLWLNKDWPAKLKPIPKCLSILYLSYKTLRSFVRYHSDSKVEIKITFSNFDNSSKENIFPSSLSILDNFKISI